MKQAAPKNSTLIADSLAYAKAQLEDGKVPAEAASIYLTMADFLDSILRSEATHITLGMNRPRTSLLVTINHANGTQTYVACEDITSFVWNLAQQVADVSALTVLE